jgi:LytS/YehU family sensor histidine kinase
MRQAMPNSFWTLLLWQLSGIWYGYIFTTPVVYWLGKRFPVDLSSRKRNLIIHITALILIALFHAFLFTISYNSVVPFGDQQVVFPFFTFFIDQFSSQFHVELMVYVMIIGISYSYDYYQRYRERDLRAAQLESQLTLSQLQVLKMQLHPHFLFNTINGIVGLVRDKKNKAAISMLVGLSDLLRQSLRNSREQEVSLREELAFLELYLDLEQMRFSDRLKIQININPEILDAVVPSLVLQPLVENSIRHGIAKRINSGLIEIDASTKDQILTIRIRDDGPGLPENWRIEESDGIGLGNTRERLYQLYGSEFGLVLRSNEGHGTEAILSLPLKYGVFDA